MSDISIIINTNLRKSDFRKCVIFTMASESVPITQYLLDISNFRRRVVIFGVYTMVWWVKETIETS